MTHTRRNRNGQRRASPPANTGHSADAHGGRSRRVLAPWGAALTPLLLAALASAGLAETPPPDPAARCLYLPPALEGRVVFYQPFEDPAAPVINRLGGQYRPGNAEPCEGLAGRGVRIAGEKGRGPSLAGLALAMNRPLTVMLWWRMEEALPQNGGFALVGVNGPRGYISNFVRGGPWCALAESNFVLQVYRWPGISDVNHLGGPVEHAPGPWRHAAVVVSRAATVQVFWDGRLRAETNLVGRTFAAEDVADTLAFGPQGGGVAMRLDEVVVLDVALDEAAVAACVASARALAEAGFPPLAHARP
jgi:hypothetical protein